MTCSACRQHRDALQKIINIFHEADDQSWGWLSEALLIARHALLDIEDTEPLGRLELYSDDDRLLCVTDWRFTNSLDKIDCEPSRVLADGKAARADLYMPNGTFALSTPVGTPESGAPIQFDSTDFIEGRVVHFPTFTLKCKNEYTCPQCGCVFSSNESPRS